MEGEMEIIQTAIGRPVEDEREDSVSLIVWQLSEFSLLLLLKQKIRHPFRSVGSLLFGRFKRALDDADKSEIIPTVKTPRIQLPKIPELPCGIVDISSLVPSNEEN